MQLRPYQQRAIDEVRLARKAGHRRILVCSPTGSGKTVIAIAMIDRAVRDFGSRVVVIAHRKELLDQFYARLVLSGHRPGLQRGADERRDPQAPVQVCSIATLVRRELPPGDLVIVDECHRCPGESYSRVLEAYPAATVIGLTATPCRLDGRPLREHFDAMVQVSCYSELIEQGAIAAPIVYAARRMPDLSGVKTVAGDYQAGELETAMREPHVIGDVVASWRKHAEGRRTVVFAVGVEHSMDLCERFQDAGARVAHLDGTTPEAERGQMLTDLETGKLEVVCNVDVLTEGWDQPKVKCAIMARPTKSLTKWMQCAGRILRPWGDQVPLILDHSGNVERHGIPHEDREWSLDGPGKRKDNCRLRVCPECYGYVETSPCPLCGHSFALAMVPRSIRTAEGVVERVTGNVTPQNSDPKRAQYDALVEEARRKGFKPGYAAAKWKEKNGGSWPSWAWSQSTKADYSRDAEWQARVQKKTREREFWQKQHQAGESLVDVPEPDGTDSFVAEVEGAFDGLGIEPTEAMLGSGEPQARDGVPASAPFVQVAKKETAKARTMPLFGGALPAPCGVVPQVRRDASDTVEGSKQ